jgi:hypothetical protein
MLTICIVVFPLLLTQNTGLPYTYRLSVRFTFHFCNSFQTPNISSVYDSNLKLSKALEKTIILGVNKPMRALKRFPNRFLFLAAARHFIALISGSNYAMSISSNWDLYNNNTMIPVFKLSFRSEQTGRHRYSRMHFQNCAWHIVWSTIICNSLTRWVLDFIFHGGLSTDYQSLRKLNRLNWFWLCDLHHNHFLILHLTIRSEHISDGIWSESNRPISLERKNRYSRHYRQPSDTVWWTCLCTSNGSILDCRGTVRWSRPPWWNPYWKTSSEWSWCQNSGYIRQISF